MVKIVKKRVHVKGTVARRHKKSWMIKAHKMHTSSGKTVNVRAHRAAARKNTYREKPKNYTRSEIRFKGQFNKVANRIAREYMKKGYSIPEAKEIGKKTAADVYRHKLAKLKK